MEYLIGGDLKLNDLYDICILHKKVRLDEISIEKIKKSRHTVDTIISNKKIVYGLSTGFGSLKNIAIDFDKLSILQNNLIISHSVGFGEAIPVEMVRAMFLLRLNCIAQGHSGVSIETANKLVEALNKNFIPLVPEQGTVGASGDLAPLSHLILGLLGLGKALDPDTKQYIDSKIVLSKLNIEPLILHAKEGLALNNGTQFTTSWTSISTYHSLRLIKIANIIAATSLEALHGTITAFDDRIHQSRHHSGQIEVAKQIRHILAPDGVCSEIGVTYPTTQDAYSLRCIPQIHGPALDLINFVKGIIENEMNSANDNPLIFDGDVISGGNFHAQYIGMCADQLAYALTLLCNNSERRLERMVNRDLNKFMPSMLIEDAGLNSGLMIVQYAAAGITAENRTLCSPGSIHSIPTSEGAEDIVSMSGWPARKAYQTVGNTYKILALELFTAIQALEYTKEKPAESIYKLKNYIRNTLGVPKIEKDCYMKEYIDKIINFLYTDSIFDIIK